MTNLSDRQVDAVIQQIEHVVREVVVPSATGQVRAEAQGVLHEMVVCEVRQEVRREIARLTSDKVRSSVPVESIRVILDRYSQGNTTRDADSDFAERDVTSWLRWFDSKRGVR